MALPALKLLNCVKCTGGSTAQFDAWLVAWLAWGLAINENEVRQLGPVRFVRWFESLDPLGRWVIGSCGLKFRCIFDAFWIHFAWKIRSSCVLSRSRRSERANWQIEQIEQRIWAKFGSKGPTQTLSTRCIPVLHGIFHTSCRLGAAAA